MNMQQFVEFKPDKSSKHLNTIKIQSIAASIRQHGLGVLQYNNTFSNPLMYIPFFYLLLTCISIRRIFTFTPTHSPTYP